MILRPPRPTRTATLFPYTTLFRSMTDDVTVHAHLIVRQGSRADFNTPVLVLDEGALDRNIAAMAALAKAHGVGLRPHAKTHKSVDIARRQIAAGALGICCAKIGEAEVMADGGISGILITSPVAAPRAVERTDERRVGEEGGSAGKLGWGRDT